MLVAKERENEGGYFGGCEVLWLTERAWARWGLNTTVG